MSATAAPADSQLVIERWRNTFAAAGGSVLREAATQDVAHRIERSIRKDFSASCALALGRIGSGTTGFWLIRELHLNFIVDVSMPAAGDIAADWSNRFAALLAEIIQRGPDSDEGVLYFASRAAYIVQFILDLFAGQAWSKWYYEEFHSLAMLPLSRAITEVLCREPEDGVKAIVHFARTARLDQVLCAITEADAQRIYYCCFRDAQANASDSDLALWVGRLLNVWNEEPVSSAGAAQTVFHCALHWLALLGARFPTDSEASPCVAVEGLIELRRVLKEIRSPIIADRLIRQLVEGKMSLEEAIKTASYQGAASPDKALRFLVARAEGDGDWAVQAAAVLLKDQFSPIQAILAGESMVSGFAGMFLLGPALVRLNSLVDAIAGGGEQAREIASFLRYIILAKCAGSVRAVDASGDMAPRLLSGCHRSQLRDGRQACPELDLERAFALLFENLPGWADCSGHCLLAEIIATSNREREVILLRDVPSNEWLYARTIEADDKAREHALIAGLKVIRESTGNVPSLLLHPSLAAVAESMELRSGTDCVIVLDIERPSRAVEEALSPGRIPVPMPPEKYAQMVRPSEREFSYFSFANLWPDSDSSFDLLGVLLSRVAIREFARHLMGFQASSPEHLYRNFLDGTGTLRNQPERIEVELPRSPLLLVLQLSGLTRQTFTLPWLEGKEVCLLPPKE